MIKKSPVAINFTTDMSDRIASLRAVSIRLHFTQTAKTNAHCPICDAERTINHGVILIPVASTGRENSTVIAQMDITLHAYGQCDKNINNHVQQDI